MPKRRHTDEQIIAILREGDAGAPLGELCRRHGISSTTYHRWKAQYGGLQVDEARRLRALEDENRRLRTNKTPILRRAAAARRCRWPGQRSSSR